ncbi:MAG TPA: hypothetical protein VFD32_22915 [Dehalococcoidia bacterium]|nr:hypothetical protein [Dehalococcoidia bacterium]
MDAQPPQETSEVSRTGVLVTGDHPLSLCIAIAKHGEVQRERACLDRTGDAAARQATVEV